VFAAPGDVTRRMPVCDGQPQSIARLTQGTGLTAGQQVPILDQARVITSKRVGRESRFEVRPIALAEAYRYLERASKHGTMQWSVKALVEG
jgi:hypothetical protein